MLEDKRFVRIRSRGFLEGVVLSFKCNNKADYVCFGRSYGVSGAMASYYRISLVGAGCLIE
ncbi:hypothetical protein [Vulcanisaeta distributa]|uniref:hypothetical protein n=1 Tax=Vulcanisaeta distributa TaxID=164451 RepID=UPI0006D10815|nr:hypothetical protein [Vulcanisaeta distributa]